MIDDQRHARRRLIQQQPVVVLSMVTETLAVIACKDDQRVRIEAGGFQVGMEADQLGVGVGHLTEIGVVGILPGKGRRRVVGQMGVIEVNPCKERLFRIFFEPRQGVVHHRFCTPLNLSEGHERGVESAFGLGVACESLVDAPP